MSSVPGGIDGLEAVFDDGSLVADAGLLLAGTVMSRLGLEALIDDTVRPGGSAGSGSGRKVLTLVASMLVGGRCIDDAQRLRSGLGGGGAALWGGGAVDCGVVFAGRSRSGMCASSTRLWSRHRCGRGLLAPRPTSRR